MSLSSLVARDISRELNTSWTPHDELESLDACLLTHALRSKDEHFSPHFFDLKQVMTSKKLLKSYCALIDSVKIAEDSSTVQNWRHVISSLVTEKAISQATREACTLELCKCLAQNNSELVEAINLLKQLLLVNPHLEQAWRQRGLLFLKIDVPLLAQVHFGQPGVTIEDSLREEVRDLIFHLHHGLTFSQRRKRLRDLTSSELISRAELICNEDFLSSACIYFAAAVEHPQTTVEMQVHAMLKISECWRRKKDDSLLDKCVVLCNMAWKLGPMDSIFQERIHVWLAKRNYEFALLDVEGLLVFNPQSTFAVSMKKRILNLQAAAGPPEIDSSRKRPSGIKIIHEWQQGDLTRKKHPFIGGGEIQVDDKLLWAIDVEDERKKWWSWFGMNNTYDESCILVGPDFVSFPLGLDYDLKEDDVVWTWNDVQWSMHCLILPEQQRRCDTRTGRDLSALLLFQGRFRPLTTGWCGGWFADKELTDMQELNGIRLLVGALVVPPRPLIPPTLSVLGWMYYYYSLAFVFVVMAVVWINK